MTLKEWIVLALRVLGIYRLLLALDSLVTLTDMVMGFYRPQYITAHASVVAAGVDIVVGLLLLLGARNFAEVICRNDERIPEAGDDEIGAPDSDPPSTE